MKKTLHLILGSGGHAKVLIAALQASGASIEGILDSDPLQKGKEVLGVQVLGGDELLQRYSAQEIFLVNGIGSIGSTDRRKIIFERSRSTGYRFASVIHPSAVIGPEVTLEEGVQVMAGAVIQPGCRIGMNAIVNTRASVDHDCFVGAHSHLAPGCVLSGGVRVAVGAHVGTGACVIQGVSIGEGSVIGAGAVVVESIPDRVTATGIPARFS